MSSKHGKRRARELSKGAGSGSKTKGKRGAELRAFIQRFPAPGRLALAFYLTSIVLGNAYLFWLVWHSQLSLTGLISLVLVEGILLSMLEAVQRTWVPAHHRMRYEVENLSLPQKAVSWIAFVVGVGGAYLMWIFLMKEGEQLAAFASTYSAWRSSGLDFALLMTLSFAIFGLHADHQHYRQGNQPLVSSVSMEAMTRRITFGYGAVVIAIPLFGLFALATWLIVKAVGKRDGGNWNLFGGLAVIASYFSIFLALATLADSGPRGWAFVYLLNKVIVEGLFALLPILARRAAGESPGELAPIATPDLR